MQAWLLVGRCHQPEEQQKSRKAVNLLSTAPARGATALDSSIVSPAMSERRSQLQRQ